MRRYTLGLRGREFVIDVQELDADRFEVQVEGESYEVTLSENENLPQAIITPGYLPASPATPAGATAAATADTGRARAAPATATTAAAPPARPAAAGKGSALNAPMPGVILEVKVQPGDVVQRGQQVLVLEAMKMHNLIGAPKNGTITEVCVAAGQAVGHGDVLIRYLAG